MLHFIAKKQVSRAAGNVEQQCSLAEELFTLGRKQCRRRMALLMGRADERDAPGQRERLGSADARQKTGHITALHRARLFRHTYGADLGQVKLAAQFCQHLGQGDCVMKKGVALAQAQLALLHRKETLFCANNLSGCIKDGQRGCIIAGVDAQRIAAHSCSGSASRPCSRATVPSRPLTN